MDRISKSALSMDLCTFETSVMDDDRLVFQRFLGHREIKDGYKWKVHSHCWICDQHRYTLFMWSKNLANSDVFIKNDATSLFTV